VKLLIILSLFISIITANEKYETSKTSCLQQSNYPGKTLEEIKGILILQSKRESIEELYGSMILSKTAVENGKLVNDEIKQKAIGAVRVKGNPKFYNGKNLGEICSDINAYITKKDLEKYSPKTVKLDKFCFNDPSVPMNKVKDEAKLAAYKEIISQYNPSLNIEKSKRAQYIHQFKISNDKFDFDTASYCFQATAKIMPYELELDNTIPSNNKIKMQKESSTVIMGKGSQLEPYIISIQNQKVKYKKNNKYNWFKFTLSKSQKINIHQHSDGIYQFYILNEALEEVTESNPTYSNEIDKKLEEGTYILKIENRGNSGNASFNIMFGSNSDLSNLPEYKGEVSIQNQKVKYKKNNKYNWFKFTLSKSQKINIHQHSDGIYQFYILNEALEEVTESNPTYSNEIDKKLEEGTYILKIENRGNSGNASFNIMFGN